LGAEWTAWTGLPMVFAVWAGKKQFLTPDVAQTFLASYRWGKEHMEEIVSRAERERGFPEAVAREYLTRYINFELSARHLAGMALYRKHVGELETFPVGV
jgi:chorismate dehydratase